MDTGGPSQWDVDDTHLTNTDAVVPVLSCHSQGALTVHTELRTGPRCGSGANRWKGWRAEPMPSGSATAASVPLVCTGCPRPARTSGGDGFVAEHTDALCGIDITEHPTARGR